MFFEVKTFFIQNILNNRENLKNNRQKVGYIGQKINQKSANILSSLKTNKQKAEFSGLTGWMKNQYHVCY